MLVLQDAELDRVKQVREAEIVFARKQNELEIKMTNELAVIETDKFSQTVEAIGPTTLEAIASAGPDTQV